MGAGTDDKSAKWIQDSISALIVRTERMLEVAESGEWERVIALESERSSQMRSFFDSLSQELREQNSLHLRQAIEQIISLDSEIISFCEKSKNEAAKAFQESQSARQATAAYQKQYNASKG